MAVVKWTFFDPTADVTYTFEINPNAGGSPPYKRNLAYQATAAADGQTLVFEGRAAPQEIEFSGVILTQSAFDAFVTWFNVKNQVKLTDDLLREFWVVISEFTPTRQRAHSYPWKHSYTAKATIVDWPS